MIDQSYRFSDRELNRGATLVEFALSLAVILPLLVVAFQLLYLSFVAVSVQFVATRSLREAIIGDNTLSEVENRIIGHASSLGLSVAFGDIDICPVSNAECATHDLGEPRELVYVRVQKNLYILLLGLYKVSGIEIGRNEP